MDKETRNIIQKATQEARSLLEREFSEQLEGAFDIKLDGTINDSPGEHLDPIQRVLRKRLVSAVKHFRGKLPDQSSATSDYLREAAFTTLNRFVALKMMESRGLVQECLEKGDQSSGFKEFIGLAPGLVQIKDHGYRLYIESIFDEIGQEIRVLFDRRDPAGLLWPRRLALQNLLSIINNSQLIEVWSNDETIGWVYQYFNSEDERKLMRSESAAPRNTRELAVRNQFFTPSYIVKFLVSNTLGRLWHEMRLGKTDLNRDPYFLRREDEWIPGKNSPIPLNEISPSSQDGGVSFKQLKDPRDIRIIDPACGSGHFLLHSFEVLVQIYEEAWSDEHSPPSIETNGNLQHDYKTIVELRSALPGLILKHNLFGIDIDRRCGQIAALALWMKAQSHFISVGISRNERPPIRRVNIAIAESMLGNDVVSEMFIASLGGKHGDLARGVFDLMKMAGQAGSLLRIEREIEILLEKPCSTNQSPNSNTEKWKEATAELLSIIKRFADINEHQDENRYRQRLFTEDVAHGFSFIDMCIKKYDVVLMNPPFGAFPSSIKEYVESNYKLEKPDILTAMVSRGLELGIDGRLGAITNRTIFFNKSLADWRGNKVLGNPGLEILIDLGHGVLDSALVEASAYVIGPLEPLVALSGLKQADKASYIESQCRKLSNEGDWLSVSKSLLSKSALKAVSYWAPNAILKHLASLPDLESAGVHPRVGLQTSNDFRFLRLQWEVPGEDIGRDCWVPFAKGGEYNPYADAMHLCVLWHDGAKEQRAFSEMHADRTGSSRGNDATRDFEYYYKQGLTYSERTTSDISVRILPEGTITGTSGPGIYFDEKVSALSGLVYFSSRTFRQLLELSIGSGDAVYSGSAARHYTVGNLSSSPVPLNLGSQLDNLSIRLIRSARKILSSDSTVPGPIGWDVMANLATGIEGIAKRRSEEIGSELITMLKDVCESERIIHQYLGLDESSIKFIEEQGGPLPDSFSSSEPDKDRLQELWCLSMEQLVYVASAEVGASRQITKKSWYADRRVELISAILGVNGVDIVKSILKIDPYAFCSLKTVAKRVIEEALNIAFGCSRIVNGDPSDIERNPFHPAWAICARKVQGQSKVFACDEGHEFDIGKSITDVLGNIIGDSASDLIEEIRSALETRSITDFFRKAYFAPHIRQYSNSRRKAPIHWQFGTQSSNYSVWVCYHSLNKDTLYRVLQDFVIPRIQYEEKSLRTYRQEAGQSPSAKQRKEIINSESALNGLIEFRHEIEKVAPLWNPNLNDGVIINAAPLWKLFGHQRGWQKDCKNTWDKMVAGEYDWSHLAMHLWPERVIRNCIQDRSLAVAHGIEHLIWHENSNGKWAAIQPDDSSLNKLVSDRYSSAIDDSLKCLINTSQPSKTRSNSKAATSQGGAP